jgi:uncharacterized membrane protein (UPF0127 family)
MTKNKKISKNKPKSNLPNYYKIAALLIIVIAAIYFIFISGGKSPDNTEEEYMFRKDGELTFLDSSGMVLTKIDIQIARNEYDRELGLMFRKSMNENQGMLFIFPDERIRNFWMRNTEIPLDMIFINDSKTILNIAKNTIPYSDTSYSSAGPARYVLEVNGGFTEKHKINRGVKVNWTLTH